MIVDGWVLAKDEKVDCCVYVWARTRCHQWMVNRSKFLAQTGDESGSKDVVRNVWSKFLARMLQIVRCHDYCVCVLARNESG